MNSLSIFGGGIPNPFAQNGGYLTNDQNRQMMEQFERCLVSVVEDGNGEFIKALVAKMDNPYYSTASRDTRRRWRDDRDDYEGRRAYAFRDRDYRKNSRNRYEEESGTCMQGLWLELEELEKKSKKIPGFSMKTHLKKEYPDLDDEEIKVLSLLAEKGGMHHFAKELGLEVDELYEVLSEVAEKVNGERR